MSANKSATISMLTLSMVTACGQVEFNNTGTDVEIGDAGTQAIYEGGVLAPYRCTRDPGGKADIGFDSGAPMQIWLDGTQLFNCLDLVALPCPAHGTQPVLFDCRTKDLAQ
jgi:hypothetical protein